MDDFRTREELEDALNDYLTALFDVQNDVERCVRVLLRNPTDASQINNLFRHVHTLKSNAAMCRLDFLVNFAHPLEDVMSAVRSGELPLTPMLAEIFLMGVDRIRLAAEMAAARQPLEYLNLGVLGVALRDLAKMDVAAVNATAPKIIEMFGGGSLPVEDAVLTGATGMPQSTLAQITAAHTADIALFQQISTLGECHSPFWQGRTERITGFARRMNELNGNLIDPYQLDAAVAMHDMGMSFLPEGFWTKQGKLNDIELRELRAHPNIGYELLRRIPGLQDAATYVLQHHERPDGRGYPQGLLADQISEGARLLAIVDAFEAMTHERGDRYHKRSILRAVTEINASDGQFARNWIQAFNAAARELLSQSNA